MEIKYLYHYSKERYDVLKTRLAQSIVTDEEKQAGILRAKETYRLAPYYEHISFFLEPIPLDILGAIYGKNHHTWYPGNELYEYKIDINKLGVFKFELVESPEATKFYYDPKNDSLTLEEYYKELYKLRLRLNEIGYDKQSLIKVCSSMLGLTRSCYLQIPSRPNWNEIKDKYAATVPHVMLYPKTGIVKYESITKVKVGSKINKLQEW